MNKEYLAYMDGKRDEEAMLVERIAKLSALLKMDFGISTAMPNPEADFSHTPPCEWETEVQDQTLDQLDGLCDYLTELENRARETREAVSLLFTVRMDMRAKPEDFED